MTQNLYLDLHIIQTVPPSNINRDDAGSPKQAVYGGVRRTRVSSQAWKRATRKYFEEQQGSTEDQATRTKRIGGLLTARILKLGVADAEAASRIAHAVIESSIKMDTKKKENTSYLLFFGTGQLDGIAEQIVNRFDELDELDDKKLKDQVKDIDVITHLSDGHPLGVALFGRMVAELANLNVDASVQVAHALGTHGSEVEFDYYTAVDDENTDEETGAGMIGTVEFNSATLYRYATVAIHQLAENLGGNEHVPEAVQQFVEAFVNSIPSGKQNVFGHHTRPSLVLAILRDDQPVNLVGAFEQPIATKSGTGFETQSKIALAKLYDEEKQRWGETPLLEVASYGGDPLTGVPESVNNTELLRQINAAVSSALVSEES